MKLAEGFHLMDHPINYRKQPEWSGRLTCALCGGIFISSTHSDGGRRAKYCCNAHKQKAYRARKQSVTKLGL